jgi:hypothetical protein
VISENEFQADPFWPLQYKLLYDAQALEHRLTYRVSVRVSTNNAQLLAINDFAHQFTVNSDSKNFDVLVKLVRARVSSLAEIDMICAEAGYRVSIYKWIFSPLQQERQEPPDFHPEKIGIWYQI